MFINRVNLDADSIGIKMFDISSGGVELTYGGVELPSGRLDHANPRLDLSSGGVFG